MACVQRGWAMARTIPKIAATRRARRRSCLSRTRVRYFFWLARRNSIAAHGTRRWRRRLMRWMTIGAATRGRPHHSIGRKSNVGTPGSTVEKGQTAMLARRERNFTSAASTGSPVRMRE